MKLNEVIEEGLDISIELIVDSYSTSSAGGFIKAKVELTFNNEFVSESTAILDLDDLKHLINEV